MNPQSAHGSPSSLVCGSIPMQRLAMELGRSFAQVWDRACPGCSRGRIKLRSRGLAMAIKPSRLTNPSLWRKEEGSEEGDAVQEERFGLGVAVPEKINWGGFFLKQPGEQGGDRVCACKPGEREIAD